MTQQESLKLCMKIWSGYTKYVRSQANKNRIVDSLYFGKFYGETANLDDSDYVQKVDQVANMDVYGHIVDNKLAVDFKLQKRQ